MAEILNTISIISFVLMAIFILLTIVLWFLFKIPNVMGDLSGRNARKSIQMMRQSNEQSGKKTYKSSKDNLERGKLTGTMKGIDKKSDSYEETGLLKENLTKGTSNEETGLLISEETQLLVGEETGLLVEEGVTENLSLNTKRTDRINAKVTIKMISSEIHIHTKEVIQ